MRAAPPVESILDAIGGTPLVRLRRVTAPRGAAVFAKLESLNPGGSVKDRIAVSMIEAAERDGRLRTGAHLVEPTSGNTGVALALACAVKGYKLTLVMPDSTSIEHRQALEDYGAEIVLTTAEEGFAPSVTTAREIARSRGALMLDQFANRANPEAHRAGTGPELLSALDAVGLVPDALVAGVGTGGTLTGVARAFRERGHEALVVAVEPASCPILSGGSAGATRIQGLGAGFIPDVLDRSAYDRVVQVTDEGAWFMKERLSREEGILVGVSSGAAALVSAQLAVELGSGKVVVTVFPDSGERYFSVAEWFAIGVGARP